MKSRKGWLYLPIEVKVRELDAKLLLAYYAVKEGYHVVIGEHHMVELASTVYPKGIFLSKGYPRGFRKRIITNAINNGHTVVELDEEGLLVDDKTQYLHDRMLKDMLNLVTQEYCWGNFQKQVITNAYPGNEQKCYVVGNPRFDLLTPKFRVIYKKDAEKIRKNLGEFVLINTRFSIYNSLKGLNKDKTDTATMYFKNLYENFVGMIKAISREFPGTNFVIRPHPGENMDSYRHEFSSFNNIHVIHEGNIIKWLLAAKVVIHNGCTSSIEAFLLGKPIISYMPTTSDHYDVELPNQLGMEVSNIREVNVLLQSMLSNNEFIINKYKEKMNQKRTILNDYYRSENRFSYEYILSLMNTISLPEMSRSLIPHKTFYLKENKKVKFFFPSLIKEEIEDFFRNIDAIENNASHISIKRVGRNLFEIQ
jgi:surface carbohydrate biosynthesis protein